jgi:hypothetical protein
MAGLSTCDDVGFYGWSSARCGRFVIFVLGLLAGWSGTVLRAQDSQLQQSEGTQTLHVYTNSIQLPMVVLGPNRQQLKAPVAANRFSVSIDGGPWFRATHVRPEGDDPISLSILLDANGESAHLIQGIEELIAEGKVLSLQAKDHISVYGLDCRLVTLLKDVPADESLKMGMEKASASWDRRRENLRDTDCQDPAHLWDSLAFLSGELYKRPGLRVILAVSQGKDRGSKRTWNETRDYAESTSVAIFGLSEIPADIRQISNALGTGESITPSDRSPWKIVWNTENPFHQVCELSGGMVFLTQPKYLPDSMKNFLRTVRERYIVEFPRPSNATSGKHGMQVKIAHGEDYFVRSAGISVPPPDPKVLADPATVSAGPKDAPEMGTRKILTQPQ